MNEINGAEIVCWTPKGKKFDKKWKDVKKLDIIRDNGQIFINGRNKKKLQEKIGENDEAMPEFRRLVKIDDSIKSICFGWVKFRRVERGRDVVIACINYNGTIGKKYGKNDCRKRLKN